MAGQRIKAQLHLLGKKPCIVVGTPGRVIDLLERGALNFHDVRFVVLDEVIGCWTSASVTIFA